MLYLSQEGGLRYQVYSLDVDVDICKMLDNLINGIYLKLEVQYKSWVRMANFISTQFNKTSLLNNKST